MLYLNPIDIQCVVDVMERKKNVFLLFKYSDHVEPLAT